MCDSHRWEQLNYDEYFMECMAISPTLNYDNSDIAVKTLKIQIWLLTKYETKTMSQEDIINLYKQIMDFKQRREAHVRGVEMYCRELVMESKKEATDNIDNYLTTVIESNNM